MTKASVDEQRDYEEYTREQIVAAFTIVGGYIGQLVAGHMRLLPSEPDEETSPLTSRSLHTRQEVAEMLGVSPTTITRLRSEGLLVATLIGGKVKFHIDEIERAIRTGAKWNRRPEPEA